MGYVYFCEVGGNSWVAYVCLGNDLTDCEWLVNGVQS
jgi:hypothetical protein